MRIIRCNNCGELVLKKRKINEFCKPKCKTEFENKFIKKKRKEIYAHIFKTINLINDKIYIGTSFYDKSLRNSMNKFGLKNFKIKILDSAKDQTELKKKEKYWKDFYANTSVVKSVK